MTVPRLTSIPESPVQQHSLHDEYWGQLTATLPNPTPAMTCFIKYLIGIEAEKWYNQDYNDEFDMDLGTDYEYVINQCVMIKEEKL